MTAPAPPPPACLAPPPPPPPTINISHTIPPDGTLIVYCVCPEPDIVSVVYGKVIYMSFPKSLGTVTVSDIGVL